MELCLALALAAVFWAMSWPAFSAMHRGYLLETTAQDVVDCMSYARAQAVAQAAVYRLAFSSAPASYSLSRLDPADEAAGFVPAPGRWAAARKIDERLAVQAPPRPVLFFPNGTATTASVVLSAGAAGPVTVTLSGPLGSAEVAR